MTPPLSLEQVLRLSPLEDNPVWKVYEVMVGPLNGVVAPGEAVDAAHYEEAESLFRWAPQVVPLCWPRPSQRPRKRDSRRFSAPPPPLDS